MYSRGFLSPVLPCPFYWLPSAEVSWKRPQGLWWLKGRLLGNTEQQNVREVGKHWIFYATFDIPLTALPVPRLEYRLQKGASVT